MHSLQILQEFKGSSEQRIQAVFQLLLDELPDSFNVLAKTLHTDPSPIVRHEAAFVLGEKNSFIGVQPLIHAIYNDPNKFVVHESALALANLGIIGSPHSDKILNELLNDKDRDIIDTAEIALQRLHNKKNKILKNSGISASKDILRDLSNSNKERRIQAAFVLMNDASADSVSCLIEALHKEPSAIVKHEIVFSLGECIAYQVVPDLIKTLEYDTNDFVIHETLLALGTLGDSIAKDSIKNFLSHPNPNIAESAEIALDRLLH